MSHRFTFTGLVGGPARGFTLVGLCLLVCCLQAAAASNEQDARSSTFALLQSAQDKVGLRPDVLQQGWVQIQAGLEKTRSDPLQHAQWLEVEWFYFLLNDNHVRARDTLDKALQLLNAARAKPELIAEATTSYSYSLILLGQVAKAKEHLRRAIVLMSEQSNDKLLADLYFNLGDAYRKTGERMVARRYFQAASEVYRNLGMASQAGACEIKLGSLARDAGLYDQAIKRHQDALVQFRRKGEYRELVTEIELARDYVAEGKLQVAEQYARRALNDPRALFEQRIDAGIVLLQIINDRREAGITVARDPIDAAHLIRDIELLIGRSADAIHTGPARPTHQLLFARQAIRHYALNRHIDKAIAHGRAAIRVARTVAEDLRATNDDSLAWLTEAQPVLNEYVKALYKLDRPRVLPLLEAYYTRPLDPVTVRRSGVVGRAFEAQSIERFDRYRAAERALVDATDQAEKLQVSYADSDSRVAAARQLVNRRLRTRDWSRDAYLATYQARAAPKLPEDLDTVIAKGHPSVAQGDVFIRYFIQEGISFGVALADDDLQYFDLPRRSEVIKLVQSALDSLQMPGRGGADRSALNALSVLMPRQFLSHHPEAKRLVIVPDDAVQPVPFAAINLNGPSLPYRPLMDRYEIVRTKSASSYYSPATGDKAMARAMPGTADIVVFADPEFDPAATATTGLPVVHGKPIRPNLPSTRQEAENIQKTFSAYKVATYLGQAATNDILLSPSVRAASVLHIATHSYFSSTIPDVVGFSTSATPTEGKAGSGFLSLTDLFTEPFASRLVVISGCETMRGKDYSGWGVRSLADGFLSQGAGSVIGTLWSVSDAGTAQLMEGFYGALLKHEGNSATALREAQRRLMQSDRYADPYYWAGVVLESSQRSVDQRAL